MFMHDRLTKLIERIVGACGKQSQALAPGRLAEQRAARFLESQAARLIGRNVSCRGGEIDLIIDDAGTIAFVEVRMRRNASHGGAAESIDRGKRRRLLRAAEYWRLGPGRRYRRKPCRFDAVLLDSCADGPIEWLKNAFEAS